jgi:chorismate dehydratase
MTYLRIGCVPYLNAKPLIYGISKRRDVRLTLRPPAELLDLLRENQLDAALVPSLGYFLYPSYRLVSDGAIVSHTRAQSVRLYYTRPIGQIRKVLLDSNSITSSALTRILLERKYRISPSYVVGDPLSSLCSTQFDATLMIGDLTFSHDNLAYLDLGREWYEFTGLPFVYALWLTPHEGPKLRKLDSILRQAKQKGTQRLLEISEQESQRLNLSKFTCLEYLRGCIGYTLGPSEIQGLMLFYRLACRQNLCP